jgi:hypothetical protein
VGAVHTVDAYRTGRITHGRALLVLDHQQRILLRASGLWETYGEVAAVCKVARVPAPSHLRPSYRARPRGRKSSRSTARRQVPRAQPLRALALAVLPPPRPGAWLVVGNLCLVALVPALIGWGPGAGIASLAHGLRDSALVASLRAHGTRANGQLVDVQRFSADDNGGTTVTDVLTLSFLRWQVTDPAIGGRPLALDADDPLDTHAPETVVYLPSDPGTAAAAQQISGSVWHGAPTANLISGGLLTLALPPVCWLLVLRVRRRRWRRAKDLVDGLTS